MPAPTAQKLKIKEGFTLLTVDAPSDFKKNMGKMTQGVKNITNGKDPIAIGYNQVHWFVTNKAQMEKELDRILKLVKNDLVLWIYYPKGTSKIQTDLTRDKGWDKFLK